MSFMTMSIAMHRVSIMSLGPTGIARVVKELGNRVVMFGVILSSANHTSGHRCAIFIMDLKEREMNRKVGKRTFG